MTMPIVEVENLGIMFRLYHERARTFKESFVNFLKRRHHYEDFWALSGVSFKVEKGEALGIIGENGAGKSTLLRLLAGIYLPDEGRVITKGNISPLIELAAGFHEDLTGRENIYLNGALLGIKRRKIERKIDEIIDFAELGGFIDTQVKKYSSGMLLRLAFASSIFVNPDILLVDEVLAVGDAYFQEKCYQRVLEFKHKGGTILFVSHDMNAVRRICDRVILLRRGRLSAAGGVDDSINAYLKTVGAREGIAAISTKKLELVVNNGKLFLFSSGIELTARYGGHSHTRVGSAWFSSVNGRWKLLTHTPDEIVARGWFDGIPTVTFWRIRLTGERSFRFQVYLTREADISEAHIDIFLDPGYTRWKSKKGKGKIPVINEQDDDWSPIHDSSGADERSFTLEADAGKLPPITLNYQEGIPNRPRIMNTDYHLSCRSLHSLLIKPIENGIPEGDKVMVFDGEIVIGGD
jgi:ABC-type polysaccharide/polyol phosphate transport system ATPase subunit